MEHFDRTEVEISSIASFYLLGCCIGALIFGLLAYRFGRKKLFAITLIVYIISVFGVSFVNNYYLFIVCRF